MKPWLEFFILSAFLMGGFSYSQDLSDLDLEGEELKILLDEIPMEDISGKAPELRGKPGNKNTQKEKTINNELFELEKIDGFAKPSTATQNEKAYLNDLDEFKKDMGAIEFGEFEIPEDDLLPLISPTSILKKTATPKSKAIRVFEVGREEKELLELSTQVRKRVSKSDWESRLKAYNRQSYIVQKNDWLFKIARKLFGSGFYYPKIWAINNYITNPHEIEPGMVLIFNMGDMDSLPEVRLGSFEKRKFSPTDTLPDGVTDFDSFGEGAKPPWLDEKARLLSDGVFFQYATSSTIEDLKNLGDQSLITEYKNYDPPNLDMNLQLPDSYDKDGFDRSSRISISYREGFFLNTFISANPVKDFGFIDSAINESLFITKGDTLYLKIGDIDPKPGDVFSIYRYEGKVSHKRSERSGRRYSILGQAKIIKKEEKGLWSAMLTEAVNSIERGDRLTAYTPKIDRIVKKLSPRKIEGIVLTSYEKGQSLPNLGDVIYIDRGRADGVEIGDLFEVWGFKDRMTREYITYDPTYKNGEIVVISLTDNFATALITSMRREFHIGDVVITKSKEEALMAERIRLAKVSQKRRELDQKDNLDVELNLEDFNKDMIKGARRVRFTDDELAELEKLEREKSIIKSSVSELSDLEKLEKQLELAEKELTEGKRDQDKLLEGANLNDIEQKQKYSFADDLDIVEENFGKKYLDEDLNKHNNPYGLTEFDIEDVDELLNLDKNPDNNKAGYDEF